jgi:hypothetical protein
VVIGFGLMQVPQPDRSRPQSTSTTIWDDPGLPAAVGAIFERSCADCHSHRTTWPWYSYVAPVSWLVSHDVHEGRQHLDLSRWGELSTYRRHKLLEEICDEVESGEMPLEIYRPLHPDARLSEADVTTLCDWTRSARQALEDLEGPAQTQTGGGTDR